MNFLMLRGEFPRDRKNPGEILYDSLDRETDMYTHLWANVIGAGDRGIVLYFGHKYHARYSSWFDVRCVSRLEDYGTPDVPDVIFARGACPEYKAILGRWPMALRVYYGAGRHFVPPNRNYDLVLVDSEQQSRKVTKGMHIRTGLFLKPAAPHFRVVTCEKRYDACLVAVHPRDQRKRVEWVYRTAPLDITVLQIGERRGKVPKNVTVVHAKREDMPTLMCQCRVGIVPSTEDDSGPRVVPEFIACGLPVVTSTDVHLYDDAYRPIRAPLDGFWRAVRGAIGGPPGVQPIGCEAAGRRLRQQIEEI